jgi:cytoskeleton-associated protein 5
LALLYDFKQQHPEADIDRFLCKSSQFFQDYVEDGLQKIEKDRRKSGRQIVQTVSAAVPPVAPSTVNSSGTSLRHTSFSVQLFHTNNS